MNRIEREDVSVGTGIIGVYQRMPQKLERVFAEFIDNSTQSFIDHKKELEQINHSSVCIVDITWNDSYIVIKDNAYGMNRSDFRRALKLNDPKDSYSERSRSKYGMGLKIAAAYLGDKYTIKTTEYGNSECYESEVDIDKWKQENPTEVENHITDVLAYSHYTHIIIERLTHKLTKSIDTKLRRDLSNIYFNDISNGDLDIRLNGISIVAVEPDLRENTETSSVYYRDFEDSFEFEGKTYCYYGWAGILKTASTDHAGFTLSQADRGIILNYRPSEVFGKANSFQYQRIVGQISLNDDSLWKVTFNKDGFIWDNGLEKAFTQSLAENIEIASLKSIAGKLRKDVTPVITNTDVEKTIKKIQKKYESLSDVVKTVVEDVKTDEPVVVIPNNENIENIISISWEGVDYKFDIKVTEDNKDSDWLVLNKKNEENNEYYIIINGLTEYFDEYSKSACKPLIINFAVALSLARISSMRLGLKPSESNIFMRQLNEILKHSK